MMVNDIWGATAVLPEPESPARSVKPRGNPPTSAPAPTTLHPPHYGRRRHRRIIAAVVWVAGFDRIVSRLQTESRRPRSQPFPSTGTR